MTRLTIILASASTLALTLPAAAQQAAPVPSADSAESYPGEILVTATRREERLQDVPLAVNALSGESLVESGFQGLQDIQYQFSGVQFGTSPNDAGFRLRGVGSAGGFSSSSEQNVATVVDDVVIPFGNPVQSLGDLERVEVLKGPQGTQFGKNASSGVVNIVTARPELGRVGGSAFASYGELDDYNVNASINVPLGQTAAASVYGFARGNDGYVRNIVTNEDWGKTWIYGGRAKLLWEATDELTAFISADWSRNQQVGPSQLWTLNRLPSGTPLIAARNATVTALGVTPSFDNDVSVEDLSGNVDERNYGASLTLNAALGDHDLTTVTAWRRYDVKPIAFSIDAYPLPIFTGLQTGQDADFLSQELRLASANDDVVEYVAGIYLSRLRSGLNGYNSSQLRPALPFSPQPQVSITAGRSFSRTTSESVAAFVDGSVRVAPTFRILVGGRYTYDWVEAESFSTVEPNYAPGAVGPNGFTVPYTPRPRATGSNKRGDWSGRLGFDWEPADDVLLYGTVARGYLGPTVTFSGLTGQQVAVDPQTVWDVTVGAKTQFLDRRLTLNVNAYFDRYKDLQTAVFNGLEFLTENAGGFEAKGFEVETAFRFSPRFSVNGSYTFAHTEFTDYITACPDSTVLQGAAAVAAQCNAPGSTAATPLFQAAGEPLSGAPKHSVSLGADFNQPLSATLALDASATYYYRSEVQYDAGELFARQPGYDLVGLNVGVGDIDGAWRVGVFARNLFDKKFHSSVIALPFTTPGGAVNWNTRDGRRTLGVQLSGKF